MAQLKHHFLIDGERRRAWLGYAGESHILFDDSETPVSIEPLGEGRAQLQVGANVYDVIIAVDGDRVFVHLDGREYEVAFEAATAVFEHEGEASGDAIARAPMPGSVVSTPVAAGQTVAEGDVLIVIESMKLETSIAAPRAGVVETVHVAVGQTFDRDAALVTLAPLPEA
ncbi:MAG: biotin/lipoyl-containing protein [Hyphomonadaceae bacterium]|nr:biotin/lipoyl-containing protein [Hyphomonadaceae bacterium]